jgi:hypothetical protein
MRHVIVVLALLAACDEPGRQAPGDGDVIGDDATDAPVDGSFGAALSATPTALTFTALVGTTAP